MNRTVAFLSLAAALGLLALVLAVPGTQPVEPPPTTVVVPVVRPPLPPPEPVAALPGGSLSLHGRLSHPMVAPGSNEVFVTVDLQGAQVEGAHRAPVNLAVVIDRSCSMAGEKIQQAKQAARYLVQQLGEEDRLAIIHYGSEVRVLPGMQATALNKPRMEAFIRRITDDGGTNISDALQSGRAQVLSAAAHFKVNRLILISDGQPTEGVTDERGLMQLAGRLRKQGVTVSSVGVGTDFNEQVMQGIAEYGSGAYAYLRDAGMLAAVFKKDLQQAGTTVARDVELSFELPQGVELEEVLGYRHSRAGQTVRVPLTDISAGQVERVVARLRVTGEAAGRAVEVADLRLRYQDLLADRPGQAEVRLTAVTSDRPEEVAVRRDKEVAVYAARARAAQNLSRAADLFGAGRRKEARQVMQQNQAIYEEAAQVAGAPAMAAEEAQDAEIGRGFMDAKNEAEVQHQVKGAKVRALKGSGRIGSTY